MDDILKKADVHMEVGQEDTAVVYEQHSTLPANGEECTSTHIPEGGQASTHVPEGERSSILAPGGDKSSVFLAEAGNESVGGNCISPQVTVDLQDALDQLLLGGDARDNQDGQHVGMTWLEEEGIAEQTDADHHDGQVAGAERAEKENLHKVEATEGLVSTQTPLEDYSGVSAEVVAIPASLHTPACEAERSLVAASPLVEAHSATVPFSPDQEDVHVILDSLPVATQKGCGDSSVIHTTPTMSDFHTGGERWEGNSERASMAVDPGVGDAEIEGNVGNVCNTSSHQPKEDVTTLGEEVWADEVYPVSSPPLLEWRESLSQGTRGLLQESRQLIRDIRASRARSLTPRTDGTPTCVETTSNIEEQSTLGIVENLEAFITGGSKQGALHHLPASLTSGSSGVYQQEGGGGGRATASESLPVAKRCLTQTAAGWQSARRSSKLQFGPSSKAIDAWTPGEIREESRTKPKRKSLPDFWQPTTDKKKKLDFFLPQSAVSVTYPSAPNGTTAHSHGDQPPRGRPSTSSVPPALHDLEGQASLNNTGEPRTADRLGKHGSVGKSSTMVPPSPVLGRQYSLVASGLRKTQMVS